MLRRAAATSTGDHTSAFRKTPLFVRHHPLTTGNPSIWGPRKALVPAPATGEYIIAGSLASDSVVSERGLPGPSNV